MIKQNNKKWYVYIVETQSGKFYTGITLDVDRRLEEHKSSTKGAKFFRSSPAKNILYTEECCSRSEASKREYKIKQLSRKEKMKLIDQQGK
ncbi:MAG: GIY-YIG nuclease family protein [Bdellovibrionales bacterium]|nr:GIY-YIG nuclease family protein [Bdellovibrionales bacterium]